MRYLRYVFLIAVGFCLLVVALANRGVVGFMIIFASIAVGLLIGFVWEWFREHKHRADARIQRREKEKLARQVRGMRVEKSEGKDEVLALLENT